MFGQPQLDFVFGFEIQMSRGCLACLLTQIGASDENLCNHFGKPILCRLSGLAALCGVIPHPVEISPDVIDRVNILEQGNHPDGGEFGQ